MDKHNNDRIFISSFKLDTDVEKSKQNAIYFCTVLLHEIFHVFQNSKHLQSAYLEFTTEFKKLTSENRYANAENQKEEEAYLFSDYVTYLIYNRLYEINPKSSSGKNLTQAKYNLV